MAATALVLCGQASRNTARADAPRKLEMGAEARIDALLSQMTLEEKIGQLTQQFGGRHQDANPDVAGGVREDLLGAIRAGRIGSVLGAHGAEYTNAIQRAAVEESRLRIPLILGNDVIHGYRTVFPIPLGEAASWDCDLVERTARMAAVEARAAGTHWTFAPMVDITRDPRWGRIAEGSGEDPFLGSAMAAARVRGFQGTSIAAPDAVLACVKHYVAYGGAESGRDYNTVDCSEQRLRELYLPPFHAAVRAGCGSLMSAFNDLNGVPASANRFTLDRILRQEWGFDGFVVSDWNSIGELVQHGYAADAKDAAEKALLAGVDMDMSSFAYREHLSELVEQGSVPESAIDRSVRRVLRAKFALGLFDNPYADPKVEAKVTLCDAHRQLARESAARSMVLLKNEGGLLPLKKDVGSLAVIGPLADNQRDPLGTWAGIGRWEDVVTVLAGIQAAVAEGTRVQHVPGCEIDAEIDGGIDAAVEAARQAEVAVLVIGESESMSGEARCRTTLDLPAAQERLLQAVHATGKPVVVVLLNGRPLSIRWAAEHVPAILEAWHPGVECGHAVADVLFGNVNPGGKLPVTFPRAVGQVPICYNQKNTGRPPSDDRFTSKYLDLPTTPLFPFGHGLSYTTFEFRNLTITPGEIGPAGAVEVSVEVVNTGDRSGDEVVQLYVRDPVARVTRPVRELKGFRRISLKPGEMQRVTFALGPEHLGFYDEHMEYVVEPGAFHIWVGPGSEGGLEGAFIVSDPGAAQPRP
ncbi:MAG: glycoside hydrolase family 3 C-terminal domain-containing protein [Phycisphaerae bacterium]|nr:glycoside hydrolase family 3 C-terminal domain-containing protein [Phycisphaerae bacterium]